MGNIFIETSYGVKGKCKYYKAPTCHPFQTDPDNWIYCCYHPSMGNNDFEPTTQCDGEISHCEINKHAVAYRRGLALRVKNAKNKITEWEKKIMEIDYLASKGERE